jgi:hypothetical protein
MSLGCSLGLAVAVGLPLGQGSGLQGLPPGLRCWLETSVGSSLGLAVGSSLGPAVGSSLGLLLGLPVGQGCGLHGFGLWRWLEMSESSLGTAEGPSLGSAVVGS